MPEQQRRRKGPTPSKPAPTDESVDGRNKTWIQYFPAHVKDKKNTPVISEALKGKQTLHLQTGQPIAPIRLPNQAQKKSKTCVANRLSVHFHTGFRIRSPGAIDS